MKKFAMLLAAGVIAFGASAQAASVASTDTYAVITIPVVAGDNLIGVSVTPMGTEPSLATALGISASTFVKKLNADGDDYDSIEAGSYTAFEPGDAFWFTSPNARNVYEVGVAPQVTATISGVKGLNPAVVTIPSPWHLKDCNLGVSDTTSRNSTAAKIHVWNLDTKSYDTYWLKKTSDSAVQWRKGSTSADDVVINPAQGFFFDLRANKEVLITPTPVVAQ